MTTMISAEALSKTFILHGQGGLHIPVFDGLSLSVAAGECVALGGASGSGKSTLLRSLYANYRPCAGRVMVRHGEGMVDLVSAPPRDVLAVRRATIGYVSQFLRAIPRVPAREVVAEPLLTLGVGREEALARAEAMLERLNLPRRLWDVPPATFSGGEQQRVNVARGFVHPYPVLLLDEPTASLDAGNRAVVVGLIREATARGAAVIGIFHDAEVRDAVADRVIDVTSFKRAA